MQQFIWRRQHNWGIRVDIEFKSINMASKMATSQDEGVQCKAQVMQPLQMYAEAQQQHPQDCSGWQRLHGSHGTQNESCVEWQNLPNDSKLLRTYQKTHIKITQIGPVAVAWINERQHQIRQIFLRKIYSFYKISFTAKPLVLCIILGPCSNSIGMECR